MNRLPPITEAQFQRQVVQLARLLGWLVYHTRDSRGSDAGYPDLTMVRGRRVVYAELKSARGRVKPEQAVWATALAAVGGAVECYLWRPGDWDQIQQVLSRE